MAMKSLERRWSCIFLSPFLISLIGSQQLIFELKDRQFQEIIFLGDVTVAMICKITDVNIAEVTITLDGVLVAINNGQGNCLEFVISRIDSTDIVNLTCSASYNEGVHMQTITVTKTLLLNVSGIDHSCFRNGTGTNQPYQAGEKLLLSCYCRATQPCIWTETVVGTDLGTVIQPIEEESYNNKKIRRIIVGPFNDANINTLRYDCYHGSTVDRRCSIGPAEVSAGDLILNPTDPSQISLKCSVTVVFEKRNVSPTAERMSKASSTITPSEKVSVSQISTISSDEGFNVITFALVIVIVTCFITGVLLIVCAVVLCSRRYRTEGHIRQGVSEDKTRQYDRTIFSVGNTNHTAEYCTHVFKDESSHVTVDSSPTYEREIRQQPSTDKFPTYEDEKHMYFETDY